MKFVRPILVIDLGIPKSLFEKKNFNIRLHEYVIQRKTLVKKQVYVKETVPNWHINSSHEIQALYHKDFLFAALIWVNC